MKRNDQDLSISVKTRKHILYYLKEYRAYYRKRASIPQRQVLTESGVSARTTLWESAFMLQVPRKTWDALTKDSKEPLKKLHAKALYNITSVPTLKRYLAMFRANRPSIKEIATNKQQYRRLIRIFAYNNREATKPNTWIKALKEVGKAYHYPMNAAIEQLVKTNAMNSNK